MKDAYYFSHDSNARNDQRVMKVRMKYGMEGYGIYFAIIEILRETKDYKIKYSDIDAIAYELKVEQGIVDEIVFSYDLFEWEINPDGKSLLVGMPNCKMTDDDYFYSKSLKKRMEKMDIIREKRSLAGQKSAKIKQTNNKNKSNAQQMFNNKRKEKEIKINNIKERMQSFKDEIYIYKDKYDESLLADFYNYWSEPNRSNTKMNYELKPTFDISRRLVTWAKNDFSNNNVKNGATGYKLDANGKFYIAYCSKCNISDFYKEEDLKQDSRCCNSSLSPNKMEIN